MKRLFLFLLLLASMAAHAQMILTEYSYPWIVMGTDTIKIATANSLYPLLAPAAGGTWDFSLMSDSLPVFYDTRLPSIVYEYADSNEYSLMRFAYNGNANSSILSNGMLEYGVIINDTTYNLGFLTTSAFDSLFIPTQNCLYSSQRTKVAFPATYGSSWSSAYSYNVAFQLSTTIPVLHHAPGVVRSHITEQSEVVGWGTAQVNDLAGTPTDYSNVLQVQCRTIKQDSFFLNSAPMPGTLMTLFALQQGMQDTLYEQHYLKKGEVTPLVNIRFKDAAYTQPVSARRLVQRLRPDVGVADAGRSQVCVFPNPVTGKELLVEMASGRYDYTLVDVAGRKVAGGNLIVTNRKGRIVLPDNVVNGVYYLCVSGASAVAVQVVR